MHDWQVWDILGMKLAHLAAGAAGGVVRALSRPDQPFWRRASTTLIGMLCAAYLTPVVAPIAFSVTGPLGGVTPASFEAMVGFLVGTSGLSLAEWLIRQAQARFEARG